MNGRAILAFMTAVGAADFVALEAICTGDFEAELPYSDPPKRLEGFAAYRSAITKSLEIFRFELALTTIHPGLDPDLLIAEYTSEGTATPTGKPYRNVYIGVFRFREGRICGLREFFNPVPAMTSLEGD
jgi:ketosteroid isomerase-like protein